MSARSPAGGVPAAPLFRAGELPGLDVLGQALHEVELGSSQGEEFQGTLAYLCCVEDTRRRWDPKTPWVLPTSFVQEALLVISALGLAASYLLTWDLWQPRVGPPNLPAVGALQSIGFGVPLLLAALSAPLFPRLAATLHAGLLILAILGDQVRIQPEFASLAILLFAAAWPSTGLRVARWHLTTLWAWAGMHKLLSGGWPSGGASFIATSLGAPGLRPLIAVAVPLLELGLAFLALTPKTWKALRWTAPVFHFGVLLPLALTGWNTAVWPWNLCLAASAPLLFSDAFKHPAGDRRRVSQRALPVAVAAFLALYPVGFYFGTMDAYLAHNLYSSNTAEAAICSSTPRNGPCRTTSFSTWENLNVPLPPENRLFTEWFERICQPDEVLRIDGRWTRLSERSVTLVPCTQSRFTE